MKSDQPKILKTDMQLKAFMHPVRSKITGLLTSTPMTITQVARKLEVPPANLTHHFKKLENAKIIKLHEERDIGRVVERYFIATAIDFIVDQETDDANSKVLNFLKNDLSKNISQLKNDDSEELIGLIKRSKINKKSFSKFSKKLLNLIDEFSELSEEDGETYALNLSLYPHNIDYGPLKKIQFHKKEKK
jgi:predicted transcriptional regulator